MALHGRIRDAKTIAGILWLGEKASAVGVRIAGRLTASPCRVRDRGSNAGLC